MSPDEKRIAPPTFAISTWCRFLSLFARRVKGWNFVLVLPLLFLAITAVALPPAFTYEYCDDRADRNGSIVRCLENHSVQLGLGEIVAFLIISLLFAVLSAGFAWAGHRRRRRSLRRAYEDRLQRVRDHVATGTVAPDAFDEVQRIWRPLVRGDHPAIRARAGTSSAIIFNVFSSLALGVGLTIYIIGLVAMTADPDAQEEAREFTIVWNAIFLPLNLGFAVTVIGGWIAFPRAHVQAVQGYDDAVEELERSEVRILAGSSPARRGRTAVVTEGPGFSPYRERARSE